MVTAERNGRGYLILDGSATHWATSGRYFAKRRYFQDGNSPPSDTLRERSGVHGSGVKSPARNPHDRDVDDDPRARAPARGAATRPARENLPNPDSSTRQSSRVEDENHGAIASAGARRRGGAVLRGRCGRRHAALVRDRGYPPPPPRRLPRHPPRIALRRAGVCARRHRRVRARGLHPDPSHGHLPPRALHGEPHGHVRAGRLPVQHRHGDDDPVRARVDVAGRGRGLVPDGSRH